MINLRLPFAKVAKVAITALTRLVARILSLDSEGVWVSNIVPETIFFPDWTFPGNRSGQHYRHQEPAYFIAWNDQVPDEFGNYDGTTLREVYPDSVFVWNDEVDGDSQGLHGHMYFVREGGGAS